MVILRTFPFLGYLRFIELKHGRISSCDKFSFIVLGRWLLHLSVTVHRTVFNGPYVFLSFCNEYWFSFSLVIFVRVFNTFIT